MPLTFSLPHLGLLSSLTHKTLACARANIKHVSISSGVTQQG